ncbi:MAG: hypothetical protein WCF33_01425 [Pseudonocardiaceae bacterium]
MTQGVDVRRQELLERIKTRQVNINAYVRKLGRRRELMAKISIVSSTTAAVLAVGPTVGGEGFTQTVQRGLGWASDSSVYRLLCLPIVAINVVAAVFTKLNNSSDPTERISIAEACNAALEKLYADVEYGKMAVKYAGGEYGQIVARALFVPEDATNDVDSKKRISAGVAIPGIAIVFGCIVLLTTVIGLGRGAAATEPQVSPQVALSAHQVKDGDTYFATISGFSPSEDVKLSWSGPTSGLMGVLRADSRGTASLGPIHETDPSGTYAITAIGLTSGQMTSTKLVVQRRN